MYSVVINTVFVVHHFQDFISCLPWFFSSSSLKFTVICDFLSVQVTNVCEIWYVGRGRWVMHDSMQGQGHEPLKQLSLLPFKMGAGNWPLILKLGHNIWIYSGWIFDICPSFCVTWLWTWHKRQLRRVDRQSCTGLIFDIFSRLGFQLKWPSVVTQGHCWCQFNRSSMVCRPIILSKV